MSKFLNPQSYSHLCDDCKATLQRLTTIMEEAGADTADPEAPIMKMYDRGLFCGGKECDADL